MLAHITLLFLLESPFQQLADAFGSSLFWIMLAFFTLLGAAVFRFYVKSDNDMSEEDLYFSAQLDRQELKFINAEKQSTHGPFRPTEVEADMTPLQQTYWKVSAQNKEGKVLEFWARVDYKNTSLLTIEWIPGIKKLQQTNA